MTLSSTATEPTVVIQPRRGLFNLDLRAIWEYRELLYFFVWRDVKVRYKQTAIGAAWAIIQPVMTILIFTVIFGKLAKIPSDGLPYPVFAYAALLPWNYFSHALGRCGNVLVSNSGLITKVYFPRLMLPLATTVTPVVDFLFSLATLLLLMLWYGILPTARILVLPAFLLLAQMTAMSVGLWLAPVNVRFRDVAYTIPFLTQFWMYASPVIYPVSLVPERWRLLYSLNPMAGVIEGFRWALLGKAAPDLRAMAISVAVVVLLFLGGVVYFRRMERTFADVV